MMRWRSGPQADLSRLPVSLDLRGISLAEGMRAALAIAAVMLLNEWFNLPLLTESAAGALLTCLCDTVGPLRRRVPALIIFAVLGSALTAGFGLVRPFGLPVVVPIATLSILAFSFARVWGPVALQVGNLLTVVAVISLDNIEPPHLALTLGALFSAGSLWAIVLTMLIWRIHPYRPARRALADVFRRLGSLVADLVPLLQPGDPTTSRDPAWADHARAHRRHVRDGIEAARVLVLDTVRIRGGGSTRANQSVIQIEAADQLFGVLIALSDVLEQADAPAREAAAHALPALRLLLAALSDATALDHITDDPEIRAMTARLLESFAELKAVPSLAGLAAAIIIRLRIALLLTTPEGLNPGRESVDGAGARFRDRVLAPVRANLSWQSPILRHAVRAGIVSAPALAFTLSMGDAYAHWLTMTLVLTLQPFFALTWQRALERSAGTVLGGVAAAGMAMFVHSPLTTAIIMVPLAIAAFAMRAVSFGLFMACLTPMVVLLSELGRPGASELFIATARAGYTIAGGALAVLGGALLWPSWEPIRVRQALAAAIKAHADYANLELGALINPGATIAHELEAIRRSAGLASNALETALSRALQEPRQQARAEAQTALLVDAALRRLAGRLLALQHDPAQAGTDPEMLAAWQAWLTQAFEALQAGHPLPSAQPPDRGHPALGRIARQIELIAGAMLPTGASVTDPAAAMAPT